MLCAQNTCDAPLTRYAYASSNGDLDPFSSHTHTGLHLMQDQLGLFTTDGVFAETGAHLVVLYAVLDVDQAHHLELLG